MKLFHIFYVFGTISVFECALFSIRTALLRLAVVGLDADELVPDDSALEQVQSNVVLGAYQ